MLFVRPSLIPLLSLWVVLGTHNIQGAEAQRPVDVSTLIKSTDAEFVAVQNGNWEEPTTWSNGILPNRNGFTYIPSGIGVTLNSDSVPSIGSLNIDGILRFIHDRTTKLEVDFIRVGDTGTLQIGADVFTPVSSEVTAEIVFTGVARRVENNFMGNGLFSEPGGTVLMYGDPQKTTFLAITDSATTTPSLLVGSSSILLDSSGASLIRNGWKVGDEIMITGTKYARDALQDERFRIRSLTPTSNGGLEIGLGSVNNAQTTASMVHDHRPIFQPNVYIGNLSRNIVLRSQPENVSLLHRRGHVFLMSYNVFIDGVEFRDLGRSDKTRDQEDSPVDGDNDGFINQRGRYAVHFHRNLDNPGASATTPAVVKRSVVNKGPGWGFVSHSSNVNFEDCIAYGFVGAGFAAEGGDEIGVMQGNLASHMEGDNSFVEGARFEQGTRPHDEVRIRIQNGDLGFTGDGFWIQSPGVELIGNIATDCDGHGIVIWTQGLYETDLEEEVGFRTNLISWGDALHRVFTDGGANHFNRAVVQDLSMRRFENNVIYNSFVGLRIRFHNQANRSFRRNFTSITTERRMDFFEATTFANTRIYNCERGAQLSYVRRLVMDQLEIYNLDPASNATAGIIAELAMLDATFNDLVVSGYPLALTLGPPRTIKVVPRTTSFVLVNPSITLLDPSAPIGPANYHMKLDNVTWGPDFPRTAVFTPLPRERR